ncbi:MBL fold metallo-hydrolase [Virgibacillus sediminis]|uniref:MBL fold metallo-hydrolase n=1 Tax=Virgibacillus sediminis TaxID=202260 RepID=A0ABV7A5T6_9BACI
MQVLDDTVTQFTIPTPFSVGDVHAYLLKGEVLTLIDAGVRTKDASDAMRLQLKELNYSPIDIEQIILTHHHPDHTGLIDDFPRAQMLSAHENAERWVTGNERFFQECEEFFLNCYRTWSVPEVYFGEASANLLDVLNYGGRGTITNFLSEGGGLPGHEEWRVIETKGHAQSHLSFLRDSDRVLVGGDHLLYHISPNPIIEPPQQSKQERAQPILQYRSSLHKCMELEVQKVYPGHGPVFSNVEEIIKKRLDKQEQRANHVYRLLQKEPMTPFEICRNLFPAQHEIQIDLTMSETIAQLDYLEDSGKTGKIFRNGRPVFYAK